MKYFKYQLSYNLEIIKFTLLWISAQAYAEKYINLKFKKNKN
jgi:hypothetical protein